MGPFYISNYHVCVLIRIVINRELAPPLWVALKKLPLIGNAVEGVLETLTHPLGKLSFFSLYYIFLVPRLILVVCFINILLILIM